MWKQTLIVFGVALLQGTHAQDAWTKRRNRIRPQDEEPEVDPSIYGNFAKMNEMAARGKRRSSRGMDAELAELMQSLGGGGSDMADLMNSFDGDSMAKLMESFSGEDMDITKMMSEGIGMWGDMLESPAMQEILENPDKMREAMAPFVKMFGGDTEKLEALLANPEQMKANIAQGVKDMQDLLTDPRKLEEISQQMRANLDDDTLTMLDKLASGDLSAITEAFGEMGFGAEMEELMKDSDPAALQAKLMELMGGEGNDLASILGEQGLNVGNFKQKSA